VRQLRPLGRAHPKKKTVLSQRNIKRKKNKTKEGQDIKNKLNVKWKIMSVM
jgi:hypothetical protein